MKRLLLGFLLALAPAAAQAQAIGQLGSGTVWGNSTASRAPASPSTITALVDRAISSTQGALFTRNATAWVGLAPGTAGLPLLSGGASANLAYGVLGLSGGGTAAALTASNGGVVYSSGSALAILSGTATAGQILRSGSSAAPTWSTATWPATTAAGTVNASSSANVVTATATPTLGANGGTGGQITFAGSTSGTAVLRVAAAAGTGTIFQLPASNGSNGQLLTTDGAGILTWTTVSGSGTVTSVATNNGITGGTITTTGTIGLAAIAADALLANSTGSSAAPIATAIGSCSTAASALTYNTTSHAFGCNSLGSVTSVAAGTGMAFSTITSTGSVAVDVATAGNIQAGTANKILDAAGLFSAAALTTLTDAATVTSDFSTMLNATVTLAGNRTLGNPSNSTKVGQTGCIFVVQDGTGSRTLAYASNWKFAGGVAPVLSTTAAAVDMLCYLVRTSTFIAASLTKDVK